MTKKPILPPLQTKEYYSNVLLVAPDSTPLATVGHDRADWYLTRNLGIEIPTAHPYSRTIKLNFEPKGRPESTHGLHPKETRCVVCGSTELLTLHHVVPRLIRKSFPEQDANRQHLWCLLLCEEHHLAAEALYAPILTKSQEFKAAQKATQQNSKKPTAKIKAYNILANLIKQNLIANLQQTHPTRVETLLAQAELQEMPNLEFLEAELVKEKQATTKGSELTSMFAEQFIAANGGVQNVKKLFRELFLQLEPKFLPTVALTDIY